MNDKDEWKDQVNRNLAGGDLFLVEELMNEPTVKNMVEASLILHGIWNVLQEQKYLNGKWQKISEKTIELSVAYADITGQRLFI